MEPKLDCEWNDDHVLPEVINPEVEFLFKRMIEGTHKKVNPKPGEKILDIGCGRATDGVELAKEGASVTGLEPSYVMIASAREYITENGVDMSVVHGVGEHLPFKPQTFDKVMCKGSLDHFLDPSMSIKQMGMALKPGGEVIIAIANFESLGFKLGKKVFALKKRFSSEEMSDEGMPWQIPIDHTYRFHYSNLKSMANDHLEVKQATGVSLLFGVPWWGQILAKCPRFVSTAILSTLDGVARYIPSISDVIVLRCKLKKEGMTTG